MQADLDTLKLRLGSKTTTDDGVLAGDLEAATNWVNDRVYEEMQTDAEVQEAIILLASRLYKRRQSPDGLSGFSADGVIARIAYTDPDIRSLLTRKRDMLDIGIG